MRSIDKVIKNKKDKSGKRQGYWEYYWLNSNLMSKGSFKDDKADGIWEFYNIHGSLNHKRLYENGNLIKEL